MLQLMLSGMVMGQNRVERSEKRLAIRKYGWGRTILTVVTVGMGAAFAIAAATGAIESKNAPDNDEIAFWMGMAFIALGVFVQLVHRDAIFDKTQGTFLIKQGAYINFREVSIPLDRIRNVRIGTLMAGMNLSVVIVEDCDGQRQEVQQTYGESGALAMANEIGAFLNVPVCVEPAAAGSSCAA